MTKPIPGHVPVAFNPMVLARALRNEAQRYQPRDENDLNGTLMDAAAQTIEQLVARVIGVKAT